MNDRQKRIIAELGLSEADFRPKEVSTEERLEVIEEVILEILGEEKTT